MLKASLSTSHQPFNGNKHACGLPGHWLPPVTTPTLWVLFSRALWCQVHEPWKVTLSVLLNTPADTAADEFIPAGVLLSVTPDPVQTMTHCGWWTTNRCSHIQVPINNKHVHGRNHCKHMYHCRVKAEWGHIPFVCNSQQLFFLYV